MNDNLIVLDLLCEAHITFEEALQLLSAKREKTASQQKRDKAQSIEINLIFERHQDVRD